MITQSNVQLGVELITPEEAKEYLSHNIENNRTINSSKVKIFANDMKNGAWQLNGEAIRFNEMGKLVDGQHRLSAIIQAGVPVTMVVMRNIGKDCTLFDRGTIRNTHVGFVMQGMKKELANSKTVGMVKLYLSILTNGKENQFSDSVVKEFLLNHEENVIKAKKISCAKHDKSTVNADNSVMQTAIFGALLASESEDKLKKFIDVFTTGFYDNNKERAAVQCRNDCLKREILPMGGQVYRIKACRQFEKAIYDFCRGTARLRSYAKWEQPVYIQPLTKIEEA